MLIHQLMDIWASDEEHCCEHWCPSLLYGPLFVFLLHVCLGVEEILSTTRTHARAVKEHSVWDGDGTCSVAQESLSTKLVNLP